MSPKTSIILCTYNEANYIERAIFELEKYIPNLELVIVDDNSSDGTTEIIKRLNVDNKFKAIFRKKNRGLASAFVRGLIETTGDNIGWVDTNMGELAPRFVEMTKELKLNNDIVILSRYIAGGGDKRNLIRQIQKKTLRQIINSKIPFSILKKIYSIIQEKLPISEEELNLIIKKKNLTKIEWKIDGLRIFGDKLGFSKKSFFYKIVNKKAFLINEKNLIDFSYICSFVKKKDVRLRLI